MLICSRWNFFYPENPGIYPGFETQGRRYQDSTNEFSVTLLKGLMTCIKFFKKPELSLKTSWQQWITSQICSFLPGSLTLTACNGTLLPVRLSPFQWSDTLKTFSVFLWFFFSFFSFNGKYYGVYGKHQRDYCLYNSAKLVKLYFSENWSSLDVLIFIFLLLNCPYNHACACALQGVLLQAALVTVYK